MLSYVLCGHTAEQTFSASRTFKFEKPRDVFMRVQYNRLIGASIFGTNEDSAPAR